MHKHTLKKKPSKWFTFFLIGLRIHIEKGLFLLSATFGSVSCSTTVQIACRKVLKTSFLCFAAMGLWTPLFWLRCHHSRRWPALFWDIPWWFEHPIVPIFGSFIHYYDGVETWCRNVFRTIRTSMAAFCAIHASGWWVLIWLYFFAVSRFHSLHITRNQLCLLNISAE